MAVLLGMFIFVLALLIMSLSIISWQCYNKDKSKNKSQRYYSIAMMILSIFMALGGIGMAVFSHQTGQTVGVLHQEHLSE
jgi:uncharacterized membrane protein YsdA (DUF1294 family)